MTPKEKAKYLISIHSLTILGEMGNKLNVYEVKQLAKQFALIAINFLFKHDIGYDRDGVIYDEILIDDEYWQEVKDELNKQD
jgi:hypothetical protein